MLIYKKLNVEAAFPKCDEFQLDISRPPAIKRWNNNIKVTISGKDLDIFLKCTCCSKVRTKHCVKFNNNSIQLILC